MNIWEILGIEYTTDVAAIKRAYAERAKECHPEEHPEEFQRLQNAYKTALRSAKARGREFPSENTETEQAKAKYTDNPFQGRNDRMEWLPFELENVRREESPQSAFENIRREDGKQEDSGSYDFREVHDEERQKAEQIKEQVWKALTYMIYNPYARNRQDMWQILLQGPYVAELMRQQDSQEAFVRLICRERFAGWHRDQIEFFQCYLENLQSDGAPNRELLSEEWNQLRRYAGTERTLISSPCLTPAEKQEYFALDIHNNTVLRCELGVGLKQEKVLCGDYIRWYLDYAAKNEDRLSKSYQEWVSLRKQRYEEGHWIDYEKQYRCLLMNPYVRNSVRMWQCYFGRKEIRDMLRNDGACARFIWCLADNRYLRWNEDVLLYIKGYLIELQPDGKVPPLLYSDKWKWLMKHAVRGDRQAKTLLLTGREKKVWKGLEEWCSPQNDDSEQTAEERYLNRYWKYVLLNEKSIVDLHDKTRKAGRFRDHLKYYICLIAMVVLVYCGLSVFR